LEITHGNEWKRQHGPNRPFWEPVRLVDFDGERLKALEKLRSDLIEEAATTEMSDERLALHSILEILFTQATVTGSAGIAETTRRATARLPQPTGRGRRRLTQQRREHLIGVVGQIWEVFTSHNFPLSDSKSTEN
jgi:hypothetical protein